jgi:hypothetical protein
MPGEASPVINNIQLAAETMDSGRWRKNSSFGVQDTSSAVRPARARFPQKARSMVSAGGKVGIVYGRALNQGQVDSKDGRAFSGSTQDHMSEIQQQVDNSVNQMFTENRKNALLFRIAKIQKEIDSGEADRFYNQWSQIKDPKFVYNHYDELERLQARLEALGN